MQYIGHPLFSDAIYGGDPHPRLGSLSGSYKAFVEELLCHMLPRQALHARSLGFVHPQHGRENELLKLELPADFRRRASQMGNLGGRSIAGPTPLNSKKPRCYSLATGLLCV